MLTLKVPITNAADDNFDHFFFFIYCCFFFSEKASFDISCESSARLDDSHGIQRVVFSEK